MTAESYPSLHTTLKPVPECRDRDPKKELEKLARWNKLQSAIKHIGPCPFCGVPGSYLQTARTIFVGCQHSGCAVQPYIELDPVTSTAAEAVSAWNTRRVE